MNTRLKPGAMAVALCLWVLVSPCQAHEEQESITIAIPPCSDVVMTFTKFHGLTAYLQRETGFDVHTIVPETFYEFEHAIRQGKMDFALQDPYTYVRLADRFDTSRLLKAVDMEGGSFHHGLVIARKDGKISTLADLKGKEVMFGPELSTTKWIAARELLRSNGIDPDKDLKAYTQGGCCEDIAFSVYLGAVDAGVVCDHFLPEHSEQQQELGLEPQKLVVIARTAAVPTWVFAARKGTDDQIVKKLYQALLRLRRDIPEHKKMLEDAEIGGFEETDDHDYDQIRMLIGSETD